MTSDKSSYEFSPIRLTKDMTAAENFICEHGVNLVEQYCARCTKYWNDRTTRSDTYPIDSPDMPRLLLKAYAERDAALAREAKLREVLEAIVNRSTHHMESGIAAMKDIARAALDEGEGEA